MIRKGQKYTGAILRGAFKPQLSKGFAAPSSKVTIFIDGKEHKVKI
jgi:hypothetical protein